jgi:hypothetical protein
MDSPLSVGKRTLRIASRFNGPPESGNGGYVCGEIARSIPGAVRVRLRIPPPLEKALEVTPTGEGVGLFDGDELIAEGWPDDLELDPPAAPSFEEAVEASRSFRGFVEHVFPDCFVCGPNRPSGDGLRLFPGPLADAETFATPWVPDASLAAQAPHDETVDPAFVWAALDCPGCFSFPQPEGAHLLLGELTARIDGPVRIGDRCVVVGWVIGHEGRKHLTGTAIYDGKGVCRGVARATWIEVPSA